MEERLYRAVISLLAVIDGKLDEQPTTAAYTVKAARELAVEYERRPAVTKVEASTQPAA